MRAPDLHLREASSTSSVFMRKRTQSKKNRYIPVPIFIKHGTPLPSKTGHSVQGFGHGAGRRSCERGFGPVDAHLRVVDLDPVEEQVEAGLAEPDVAHRELDARRIAEGGNAAEFSSQ